MKKRRLSREEEREKGVMLSCRVSHTLWAMLEEAAGSRSRSEVVREALLLGLEALEAESRRGAQ